MDEGKLQALREATDAWITEKFAYGSYDPSRQPQITITPW